MSRPRAGRIVMTVFSFAVAVVLVYFLPRLLHVEWSDIANKFAAMSLWEIGLLLVLWLAGLWSYTYMLKATLPGLTNLQAFTMNACSSGIGNLLPFGGAVGVAVNFALCRSWGYPRRAVAASTVVAGIWNVLIRLLVPAFGLLALILAGRMPDPKVSVLTGFAALGIIAIALVAFAALEWDGAARVVGRWLDRIGSWLPRRVRPAPGRWSTALFKTRAETSDLIRTQWVRMTGWLVTYFALQAVLFAVCLIVTGAYIGFAEAFAAFAIGRMLTALVVTPGGTGFTEAGAASLLISLGAPGGATAAAVFLFSGLVFLLEIPLGAVLWGVSTVLTRGRWSPENTAKRVGFASPSAEPARD